MIDEPFEQLATRQLNRALLAVHAATLREALDSDAGLKHSGRESDGVSANLCRALVLFASESDQPLTFQFAQALDRPVANLSSMIPFPSESIPVLREAA